MNHKGFTLVEMMLSLAIFTLIGLATVQQITLIKNTKDTSMNDMDLYNNLRAAISMMRNDLSQAFHVRYDDLGEENKNLLLRNQPVPHTVFDGRKNELIFTSLSHRNFYAERRESEQTEISYFLHNHEGAKNPSLMKRESPIIDDNLYQGGPIFTLVDNVAVFELQYWDARNSRWVDDWNSDAGEYQDRFPLQVKLVLGVDHPSGGQPVNIETKFKISYPNNTELLVQF